jgi:hypothetical protein
LKLDKVINVLTAIGPLINDIGTIILPSWLLLWASSSFRQQWAADVLPKRLNLWKNENKANQIINICRPLNSQINGNRLIPPNSSQIAGLSHNRISIAA